MEFTQINFIQDLQTKDEQSNEEYNNNNNNNNNYNVNDHDNDLSDQSLGDNIDEDIESSQISNDDDGDRSRMHVNKLHVINLKIHSHYVYH